MVRSEQSWTQDADLFASTGVAVYAMVFVLPPFLAVYALICSERIRSEGPTPKVRRVPSSIDPRFVASLVALQNYVHELSSRTVLSWYIVQQQR